MFDQLISQLSEHFGAKLALLAFTGTTLATSGFAGYKIVHTISEQNQKAAPGAVQIKTSDTTEDTIGPTASTTQTGKPAPAQQSAQMAVRNSSAKPAPSPTAGSGLSAASFKPAQVLTADTTPAGTAPQTNANQCLITLFGKTYDVSSLRSTHTGGDIFSCGTDMTALYTKQHGTDLTRMQPYLVTNTITSGTGSGGTTSSGSVTTGSAGTGSAAATGMRNEDSEEVEHELENHEDTSGQSQSQLSGEHADD